MISWGSARLRTISSHKDNKFLFLEIVIMQESLTYWSGSLIGPWQTNNIDMFCNA